LALAREIVDVPATKIHDAVFKVTLLTSFLADGELRLGLTHQCVEDCDRALVVEDETERGLKALEPGLWAACERVRKDLAVAPTDGTAIPESWWRELRDAVLAIARYQALTSVGLKAKGEIFQKVWRFANETDGLGALQMSYMRDFETLASARQHKELRPIRQAGF
jgi:hypothetical protein